MFYIIYVKTAKILSLCQNGSRHKNSMMIINLERLRHVPHQNILRLEISVDDVLLVKIFKGSCYLKIVHLC